MTEFSPSYVLDCLVLVFKELMVLLVMMVLLALALIFLMVRRPMGLQSELEPCMLHPLPLQGRQATTRAESGSKGSCYGFP